jgi:hypothetical protein
MTLRQRIEQQLNPGVATPEQQDRAHAAWMASGGTFDALRNPNLAIPPSQRTVDVQREILIDRIRQQYCSGPLKLTIKETL